MSRAGRPSQPPPPPPFALRSDGDDDERRYWDAFAERLFPAYERYWLPNIVPLTYRIVDRRNVRFRSDEELAADGFGHEDLALAQLHYTLLLHLGRVWERLEATASFDARELGFGVGFGRHDFFESFTRLSGASDVADELLERHRCRETGAYAAWDEIAGSAARRKWRKANGDPLRDVRDYRNRLVHGRIVPEWTVTLQDGGGGRAIGQHLMYPRLGKVDSYLDWRSAFDPGQMEIVIPDFDDAHLIVREAWLRTVRYAETMWQKHLI